MRETGSSCHFWLFDVTFGAAEKFQVDNLRFPAAMAGLRIKQRSAGS